MKKFLVVLMALILCFSVVACNEKDAVQEETIDVPITGGWTEATDKTITDEIRGYVEKASEGLDGMSLEPLELIATQVVAGTNYQILCNVTLVTSEEATEEKIVTIYVDLDGNAEMTDMVDPE